MSAMGSGGDHVRGEQADVPEHEDPRAADPVGQASRAGSREPGTRRSCRRTAAGTTAPRSRSALLQHQIDEPVADREEPEDARGGEDAAHRARWSRPPSRTSDASQGRPSRRRPLPRRRRLDQLWSRARAHVRHEEPEDRDADDGEGERRDEDRVIAVGMISRMRKAMSGPIAAPMLSSVRWTPNDGAEVVGPRCGGDERIARRGADALADAVGRDDGGDRGEAGREQQADARDRGERVARRTRPTWAGRRGRRRSRRRSARGR